MKPIILATAVEIIQFTPKGNTVEVIRRQRGWKWGERLTMTVERARAKYRELVANGYTKW